MKPQHLLLAIPAVAAFSVRHSFVGTSVGYGATEVSSLPSSSYSSTVWRMDIESDASSFQKNLEQVLHRPSSTLDAPVRRTGFVSVSEAEAVHGMPWKNSIDPKVTDEELLFMPFWEWQMSFMKENLSNLRAVPCTNGQTDFSYMENQKKKARIVNLCASSSEYRKIRMTYYDAGDNTQVFNSVWYPDPEYNLPVLGIDLLAFHRKKYLAIVDFQPLHAVEADHDATFQDLLEPIKNKYQSLKGKMSAKFYDETQFFSQQMLFARFEDESIVAQDLLPAFQQYVQTHVQLVRDTPPKLQNVKMVLERQQAYDTYSAERDPATGLFAAMFGNEWAQDFVHDFLFSMSERPSHGSSPPPNMAFMGGPPPPQQQHHQQPALVKPSGFGSATVSTSTPSTSTTTVQVR